jgi:hypothetical protein
MRSFVLRVAIAVLASLAIPCGVDAQWMDVGSVTTAPLNSGDSAIINYAVFSQGSNTGTSGAFATYIGGNSSALAAAISASGASLTTLESDKYIYFYQVVSTSNTLVDDLNQLRIAEPKNFNTQGFANGYNFSDTSGNINGNTNSALASTPSIVADSGANLVFNANPNGNFQPSNSGKSLTFTFLALDYPGYTALMLGGSNYTPNIYGQGQTGDGGYANGDVPVPGPEPSTFALLALAFPVFGFGYVRRLRNRLHTVVKVA